jgi:phage terminase small subunit
MAGLTPKQQRFVDEYLIDLNATQAAIRAGYTARNADVTGPRLLGNVGVAAAIARGQQKGAAKAEGGREYVLANLTEVVERCMERAPVMVREGRKVVQKTDDDGNHVWQFDARGAIGALGLLGKHHGMFVEQHDHTVHDLPPSEREARVLSLLSAARKRKSA